MGRENGRTKTRDRSRKWMPWLQDKDELDAEEQRRNELEAIEPHRELSAKEQSSELEVVRV